MYAIFNKETNERVYTKSDRFICEKKLDSMDKSKYEIRFKWVSA